MARQVILVVDSHLPRLQARQALVRRAGFLPLPAPSVGRACALLRKVRPAMVLSEAQLDDGHSADLLQGLRAVASMEHVPMAVLGTLTPGEHRALTGASHVYVPESGDEDAIIALLRDVLRRLSPDRPLHRLPTAD